MQGPKDWSLSWKWGQRHFSMTLPSSWSVLMEDDFIFTQSIRDDSWEQVEDIEEHSRDICEHLKLQVCTWPWKLTWGHSNVPGPDQGKHHPSGLLLSHLAPPLICGHPLSSPHPESRIGKCPAQTYTLILGRAHLSWRKHAVLWPPLKSVVRVGQETWCVSIPTFISLWPEILGSDSSMKLSSIDPFIQQTSTECQLCTRPWGSSNECNTVPVLEGFRV